MKKEQDIHEIGGYEVDKDEIEYYDCHHCGTSIVDTKWGMVEDAFGQYYCNGEQACIDYMVSWMEVHEYQKTGTQLVCFCDECGVDLEDFDEDKDEHYCPDCGGEEE